MSESRITTRLREQAKRKDIPEEVAALISEAYEKICQVEIRNAIAEEIISSEQFAWLMVGSNHVQSNLDALKPAYKAWKLNGGKSVFDKDYVVQTRQT